MKVQIKSAFVVDIEVRKIPGLWWKYASHCESQFMQELMNVVFIYFDVRVVLLQGKYWIFAGVCLV